MRQFVKSAAGTLALVAALAGPAKAQDFFSTGANLVAGIDQDWFVSTGNGSFSTTFISASNVVPSAWAQSNWISNSVTANNAFAPWFTFRQTFDLTGFDASSAALSFRWGCDDVPSAVSWVPVFSLNGAAPQGGGSCGAYNINAGSIVNLTSGFDGGVNTLDFYVVGNGTTDGFGLNTLSFTAQPEGVSTIPEPATMTLLATGLAGMVAARRRRKA